MKLRLAPVVVVSVLLSLSLTEVTIAQTPTQTASALPRLVRFGGTVKDLNGNPLTGVVGITLALYSEKTGGAPLWLETQNATADSSSHYAVLLGSTRPEGLPAELFTSEQARWVGVQVSGQPEQPRVLLVSAPYALKAGDAETIGGLPPSAFMLAATAAIGSSAGSTATPIPPPAATDVTTTGGTADYLAIFSGANTIIDSVLYQNGSGATAKVGINTTTPATTFDVNGAGTIRGTLTFPAVGTATATAGSFSQGLNMVASSYNSTSATAVNQTFRWHAEPAANDTTAPSATLNLLYALGTAAPTETGLKISSKGEFTFASGQKFPGASTISNVKAGTDLTGGGTTGVVTLNLDTTKVPQLAAANTFTGTQTINNAVTINSGVTTSPGLNIDTSNTGGDGIDVFSYNGYGVSATSHSADAVYGSAYGGAGVHGVSALGNGAQGNSGGGYGVYGISGGTYSVYADGTTSSYGVYGSGATWAGYFSGNVNVTGTLSKGGGSFKIDHPLDPANKFLYHSFVESPDMMNIYNGNAILGSDGTAWITLPDYFEALNRDFRYQLTAVGAPGPNLYVAQEIAANRFQIAGGKPGGKVSWQVTGVRRDAFAQAHPIIPEVQKTGDEKGKYLYPAENGQPKSMGIDENRKPRALSEMQRY